MSRKKKALRTHGRVAADAIANLIAAEMETEPMRALTRRAAEEIAMTGKCTIDVKAELIRIFGENP